MRTNRIPLLILVLMMLSSAVAIAAEKPSESFTFVVLGDSRGASDGTVPKVFTRMIAQIVKLNPAFVIHTGDLVDGSKDNGLFRKQLQEFKKAIDPLKMPFYSVPGNHEIRGLIENDVAYRQLFGAPYRSFDYGNSHFVLLDSEIPHEESRVMGNQMVWLKKDLGKNMKAAHRFVSIHQPLFPVGPHAGSSLDRFPQNRAELLDVLKRYQVEYAFVGHEHLYDRTVHDGVIQIITGGAGAPLYAPKNAGGFYHYIVVAVKGDQVTAQVVKVD